MGKFTDDIPLAPEYSVQPPSTQLLIRNLKVEQATPDVQHQAITQWLAHNNPVPSLEHSLQRHGFGLEAGSDG